MDILFGLNIVIQQWATSSGYKATVGDTTPVFLLRRRLLERRRTAAIIYAITKLDYIRLLKDYLGLFPLCSRGQANLMYTSPSPSFAVAINMFKITLFTFFSKKC